MQEIWQLKDFLQALNIKENIKLAAKITGVTIDSRAIKDGNVFVALKGKNFDAHDFVVQAEQKGAVAAIVTKKNNHINIPQIIVSDTMQALYQLARYKRKFSNAHIIAITGSVGKTSAKEMLYKFLDFYDKSYASFGNFNNHIGLPLSLSNMPNDTKFAVFELGMNHLGEIEFLSNMLRPHLAWVTLVNDAHIGNFNSFNEIVQAKSEIFSGLVKDGNIILNNSDKNFSALKKIAIEKYSFQEKNIKTYGKQQLGDLIIKGFSYQQDNIGIEILLCKKILKLQCSLYNIALIKVIMAIPLILKQLDLDEEKSLALFKQLKAVSGRGNIIEQGNFLFIDDSYNASPTSMQAAFENLAYLGKIKSRRTVAIIGTMLELGVRSKELHLGLAKDLKKYNISKVITIGEYMEDLFKVLPTEQKIKHFNKVEGNQVHIKSLLNDYDIILIKGSRGMGLERILVK